MAELLKPPAELVAAAAELAHHEERFGRYDLQPDEVRRAVAEVVSGAAGERVACLIGDAGSGRRYVVEAAVHLLSAAGRPVRLLPFGLDDLEAGGDGLPSMWEAARRALHLRSEPSKRPAGGGAGALIRDLAAVAGDGGLVLHVHDADALPHLLLAALCAAARSTPGLVVLLSAGPAGLLHEVCPGARRIHLRRLQRSELAAAAGSDELGRRLERASGGVPGLAAACLLAWSRDPGLDLAPERGAEGLPRPFLELAAACGPLVPADLVAEALGPAAGGGDVIDRLDDSWSGETAAGLDFEDLQFTHPSFPDHAVYRVPRLLHAWLGIAGGAPDATARQYADLVAARLPPGRRGSARLLLELGRAGGLPALRDRALRELAWWAGPAEVEDLTRMLETAMAAGGLHPQMLWGVVEDAEGRWPPYRCKALLEAVRRQPGGVPQAQAGDLAYLTALVLRDLGELSAALDEAVRAEENLPRRPETAARRVGSQALVGQLLLRLDRPGEALGPLTEALEQVERLPRSQVLEAPIREALAGAELACGRAEHACAHLDRALELGREVDPGPSLGRSELLKRAARLLLRAGRRDAARHALDEAVAIDRLLFGPAAPRLAGALKLLAEALEADDPAAAADLQEEAVAIEEHVFGADERVRIARSRLLDLLERSAASADRVREHLLRALDAEAHEPREAARVSVLVRRLADLDAARGDWPAARRSWLHCLDGEETGENPAAQAELLKLIGQAETEMGMAKSAADRFAAALSLLERHSGPRDPSLLDLLKTVADGHLAGGRPQQAISCLERAQDIEEEVFGCGDPRTSGNALYLAAVLRRLGRHEQAAAWEERVASRPSGAAAVPRA